jgi:ABC-type iron transport system FetAB ATPase subunit
MCQKSLDSLCREIEDLRDKAEMLQKVSELFQLLLDQLVNQQVQAVQSVVTDGIRAIFHDLNLTFEAVVSSKHNRAWVDFYLRQGNEGDPTSHRAKPLDGFGGGPSSVASLILRVLTMLRLKRFPVLLLDETLGAVSDEYVDRTGQFLSKLAEDAGVDLLLVTHKPSFLDHSNKAYRCHEVVTGAQRHLELRETRA